MHNAGTNLQKFLIERLTHLPKETVALPPSSTPSVSHHTELRVGTSDVALPADEDEKLDTVLTRVQMEYKQTQEKIVMLQKYSSDLLDLKIKRKEAKVERSFAFAFF